MKSILIAVVLFCSSLLYAGVESEVEIEGLISKILVDDIILYNDAQLTSVPKKYFQNPSNLHVGQTVSIKMPFQESLTLKHPKIERGQLNHLKQQASDKRK